MATPTFVQQLRAHIGHDELWLPAVTTVVVRETAPDAPIWQLPSVLLVQRADTETWTPIGGISEPGEDPQATAVRETKEETGLDIEVTALLGSGAVGPITYPNGDVCRFLDTAVSARIIAATKAEEDTLAETARAADEESLDAQWFTVGALPRSLSACHRMVIADAVAQRKNPAGFRPRLGYRKRRG